MSLLNNKCPAGTNWVPQRKSVVLLAEIYFSSRFFCRHKKAVRKLRRRAFFRCNYLLHYKRRGGSFRRGAFLYKSKEHDIFHLPHPMDRVYAKSVNILFLL